jgi:hypothetical protein
MAWCKRKPVTMDHQFSTYKQWRSRTFVTVIIKLYTSIKNNLQDLVNWKLISILFFYL